VDTEKITSEHKSRIFAMRVVFKAGIMFVFINLLYALFNPTPALERISIYNSLVPGRERLPYNSSENLNQAYNLSITSLEPMMRSHAVTGSKPEDEYRVLLLGDSGLWGFPLLWEEALSAQINAAGYLLPDGRHVRTYNLGYPFASVSANLLILDYAMDYEPDMVVWFVTLDALYRQKYLLEHPIVMDNPERMNTLVDRYQLDFPLDNTQPTFGEQSLYKQRRALADLIRYQLLGIPWGMTGSDAYYTPSISESKPVNDLGDEIAYQNFSPPTLPRDVLGFDLLSAGIDRAGDIPVLIVNEPIFIADGENSDLRYNNYYPRWAYDAYRDILAEKAAAHNWPYVDLWDAVPKNEFSNTPLHLTSEGHQRLSELIAPEILQRAEMSDLPSP
jgi:hypothetical protein